MITSRAVRRALTSVALAALLAAPPARAEAPPGLSGDVPVTGGVVAGSLVLWGASELAKPVLAPSTCRWCEPPGFDRSARSALLWSDTASASMLSNVLVIALPVSLSGVDYMLSGRDVRRTGEDLLVAVEAIAVAGLTTQVVKYAVGRRRPYAWAAGTREAPDDDLSFPSGHATIAFAAAGAFGTVAYLRGYSGWPWVYAGGGVAAASVAYFRTAADKHWLTDVAAGAAIGSAIGVALPLLLHRGSGGEREAWVQVTPTPLGIAGTF